MGSNKQYEMEQKKLQRLAARRKVMEQRVLHRLKKSSDIETNESYLKRDYQNYLTQHENLQKKKLLKQAFEKSTLQKDMKENHILGMVKEKNIQEERRKKAREVLHTNLNLI